MRASLQSHLINVRVGFELWRGSLEAHSRILAALALVGVVFALLASAAQASPGFSRGTSATSYYGLTSQDSPLLIETSKDGRIIKRAIGTLDISCTGGSTGAFTMTEKDSWTDVIVGLNRTFKRSFSDSDATGGSTIDQSGEFTGRFDRKRRVVTGTWRLQLVVHDPDGSVMTCDSGLQRFSARRLQA